MKKKLNDIFYFIVVAIACVIGGPILLLYFWIRFLVDIPRKGRHLAWLRLTKPEDYN